MRDLLRLFTLFIVSCAIMGAAWGAGFLAAGHLSSAGALQDGRLRTITERFTPAVLRDTASPDADTSLVAVDGAGRGSAGKGAASHGQGDALAGFWEAWETIGNRYYDELPDDRTLTYGAVRGSLRALEDPYTIFTDPVNTEVQRPDLESEFEGIGAYVTMNEDGLLVIQTPMSGQPAEQAGVQAGDIVIEVDDVDITDMNINEAVLLIRGPKGTVVSLLLVREGVAEPFVIEVVRARIEVPSVAQIRLLEDEGAPEIGYLQVTVFAAETRQELIEGIAELRAAGARALVLDLRNNPGGFLSAAVGVASEFLRDGVVTVREDSQGNRKQERVISGGSALDIPLVVLVNQGSASASEIVAGAIRDYERGVIVGERTFGKGSVQNVHDLEDGSQLRVTVEIWRTPGGTLIHKDGIEPDVVVIPPPKVATGGTADATDGDVDDDPASDDRTGADEDSDAVSPSNGDGSTDDTSGEEDDDESAQPPDVQLLRAIEEARRLVRGGA